MSSGSRRKSQKRHTSTIDQIIFVVIILLAAGFYSHPLGGFSKQQLILILLCVAVLLFGLGLFITLLRNLKVDKQIARFRYAQSQIDNMSGLEFEHFVARLLPSQGYRHIRFTEHYDFGVDIIAEKAGLLWGIQVKRLSSQVKMAAVRQAVTALKHYRCDRAMVITNSDFSSSAKELAISNNCLLIDRQELMQWLDS